jgi:uncharacterized protein
VTLRLESDERKAVSNLKKHRVSFDEASTVFRDPLARIFDDEPHSAEEPREIIIGHSILDRLVVVSFTEKPDGAVRLISARLATRNEREDYEENKQI